LENATPTAAVKILLAIIAVVFVAGSLVADYYWRRWMARRRDQQNGNPRA